MTLPKILVILGPTASGKSDLAVELAKIFNGEVISADSRQIYKGLDIGSGKITKKEMCGVPHYLLDACSPKKIFSVAEYKKLADEKIINTLKRNKLPIICGGTGFYIDAVVQNITLPEVSPNPELRKKLENKNLEELQTILKELDSERYETVDTKNKIRLIRAIEIATELGSVPQIGSNPNYEVLSIGIDWPENILKERIHKRIISRIKKGMIKEVENLHKAGLSWKRMFALGLEYRYISLFLQKKISKEEMLETLNFQTWHYVKRQMTWFKRNKKICWLTPDNISKSEDLVRLFLKK